MATSGTITGILTARQVIRKAMSLIGVLAAGRDPSAADAQFALDSLNWLMKSMQADGCNIWRQEETALAWPAGTASMDLDPRVMDVIEARWLQAPGYQRQLARWERGEYVSLPNKAQQGPPTSYYPFKNRDVFTLYMWMVPNTASTLYYTAARVIDDAGALDDNLDLPQEWTETVFYNLADRLLEPFGVVQSSPATAQRISLRAQALYQKMLDFDTPGSVYMGSAGRYGQYR